MRTDVVAPLVAMAETLGVTADDLVQALRESKTAPVEMPTVSEFLPGVEVGATAGAARTYRTYWRRFADAFGARPVDSIRPTELRAFVQDVQRNAVQRANSRGGVSAAENCVAALRAFFEAAVADGLVPYNPAGSPHLDKPRRRPSRRRPLTPSELAEIDEVTRTGGNDPHLDALLVRFHLETGARRGGALALRLMDVDIEMQTVRLREKGGTERLQPISRTLVGALLEHAHSRGASAPEDSVFRSLRGTPITRRRYNYLAERWQKALPWAWAAGVSPHWLRHTAIATVERYAGFAVARAFAGHFTPTETTTTYIAASMFEVAQVVAEMTGEPHPLQAPEE